MRIANRIFGLAALVAATISCGDVVRQGRSPVYLVLDSLQGAQGNTPGNFSFNLQSDVITNVITPDPCTAINPCPTVFNDQGQAILSIAMKDIGSPTSPNAPTTNNDVTVSRIRITYRRADGRNTPGVDVPYPVDAAATGTVSGTLRLPLVFELVRHVSKQEAPLVQLRTGGTIITTLTEVTIFGQDRVGNDVSVSGTIQVDFGNFGDSQ